MAPYPSRPALDALPQFAGTAVTRPSPQQRQDLLAFVAEAYVAGRSLREIAELTDRSQTAVRRALDQAGVRRRGPGAAAQTASGCVEA